MIKSEENDVNKDLKFSKIKYVVNAFLAPLFINKIGKSGQE